MAQVLLTLNANPLSPTAPVLSNHLQAQKYWELNNERLQSAAASLSSALDINNFVVNTLDYTQASLDQEFTRLGAAAALASNNTDQATCQEFTDLFIALARIKGIPAKRLVGYAYSSNQELKPISTIGDILHAWPAYYDKSSQSWLEIDPTWQDTTNGIDYFSKFDLNHIVFAINGTSSTLPYPAGSYASGEDASQKKVFVTFSQQEFPIIQPQLDLAVTGQAIFKYGPNWHWPGKYTISITNSTGQSWYFAKIQLDSEDMLIDMDGPMPDMIAPFQTLTIPFSVYNKAGLINHQSPLSIDVQLREGQSFYHESTVIGIGQLTIDQPEKILPLAGGLVVLTLTAGSLFLLGRRLTSALRRQGQKSEKKSQELQQFSRLIQENQTVGEESSDSQVANPGKRSSGTTDRS